MIRIIQNIKDVNKYLKSSSRKDLDLDDCCFKCKSKMHGHGSYIRYVWTGKGLYLSIKIYRHRCPVCGLTVSNIPAFLFPYYVIAVSVIEDIVQSYKLGLASIRRIAKSYNIARSTVQSYIKKRMDTNVEVLQCST